MQWQRLSISILVIGTVLNIIGAITNSFHIRQSFLIWMVSNSLFVLYFSGSSQGWWKAEPTGERTLLLMYVTFLGTATWGWIN